MDDAEPIRALLVGAIVKSLGRAAGMGVLELRGAGGEAVAVHLQCPFRVQRSDGVVVGSRDMDFSRKGSRSDAFDNFSTIFDERAEQFTAILGHRRPVVEDVTVSERGDLVITWLPSYSLQAFIDSSGRIESWRVLVRGGQHHVFPAESA